MTQNELNKIYDYDDGLLMNKSGHIYCNLDKEGYVRVRRGGKEYRAHRIIWEMFHGEIPEGYLVDHIDRDVYNNRIENLRLATRQQNNVNSCGVGKYPKGVVKNGKKYRSRITINGIYKNLGTFTTVEEASTAYNEAAKEAFGEFAYVQ